jgi:uncharacterized membrane protein
MTTGTVATRETTRFSITRVQSFVLGTMLGLYLLARFCQLDADRLPTLFIVMLHVLPSAVFALVHGSILYRPKGMLVFTACCLGVGAVAESLSLRTGFPFGHYWFTGVMGPQVMHLPVLLVFAYLGVGYVSWVLALLVLGYRGLPMRGVRVIALPVLASFLMVAWDLSMDPDWATIDRAWVWRDGGAYFGVPVSNFLGWYLTAYLFYQVFALFLRRWEPVRPMTLSRSYWRAAVLLYGICAAGNVLLFWQPLVPRIVADPSGRQWMSNDILSACVFVSVAVMGPVAILAWLRLNEREMIA